MKGNRFLSIKLLFWLCLVVLFTVQLSAATAEQAPRIEWQKCLGGSSFDYGTSIKQTSDGGYIVAGGSYSNDGNVTGNHGSQDSWVVKLDQSGEVVWQKCLGGSASDYGGSIKQTSDGGYIVAGFSNSNDGNVTGNHGGQDSWVVKLDESGEVVWQKCLGGSSSDYVHNIEQTSDAGYIVVGYSNSNDGNVTGNHGGKDSWVVKLGKSGNVVWQKCLGGSSSDFGTSVKQTSDGGYIVSGGTNSTDGNVTGNHGSQDSWVVKLDESGDVVWQKCLGGSASESANSIEQTSDGGYIVSGYSNSTDGNVTGNHGGQDSWIVKLDQSGEVVWQKCLGGSSIDYGNGIEQTSDGGYIVSGYSSSTDGNVTGNHGSYDSWVVKLDESGDVVWQKCLGGSSSDYGRNIEQTSDGGYIVSGHSDSNGGNVIGNHGKDDYWVVKLTFQAPVADFSAIPTSGSAPLNVSFTDNSKDNPASWLWNFGDGANSVEQNPVHTYSTAGNYTVNLTVSNGNGTDSKLATITVSEKPESVTEENITFTTTGSSFAPIINVTGSPTILWTFSDGTTSTSLRPDVNFGSSATRTQTLKVTPWSAVTLIDLGYSGQDGGAAPSDETIPSQTNQYVSSITGLENVAPSLVKFAACGNPITSLDFSNFVELTTVECFYSGLTSINLTNTPKLDRVCVESSDLSVLNVTDSVILGDLRVATQKNHRLDSLILPATISCWHLCCHDNILKANVPLQNAPNLKEVMIQNANQSGELHPSSTKLTVLYANNNSYTSANLSGCIPSTHTTNVRLQYNQIGHVDLMNCAGITGLQLQYNKLNQSEVDYVLHTLDGFAQTNGFVYLQGNALPSSEGLSHANNLTGRHWTIKLDSESIVSSPVPNFSTNVSEGEAPLSVQFTDLSENADVIAWDFNGDGIADSTERNPVYEFTTKGIHTVNLTATNGNGTASKLATINVTEKPAAVLSVANFSANVTSGYVPLSVQFNDTSTGLPTSWEWNFGDGSPNSTEQNPNHTYNLAGTYAVVLNASNTAGYSINKQTNYITALNNNNSGSLTLVDTNLSQSSSISRGMYTEANASNVTLTYNSILKCADITYVKTAPGWMYFTNLYPTTDSNITYTLGTEGVSSSSYVNIVASNSLVTVFKLANGDYKLASNWLADDESKQNSYITVPAANIIDNKVTFSVVCYESNRTNMLKYNDTIYTKTPFRTMNTRNQNYVFVNQPMVYFSSHLADKDTGPYVVHVYSIKQEIPRKTVTPYGTRSVSALTITYPDPENNGNGINLMKSNGQKSTIYVDTSRLDPDTVAYEKALLDAGWEMGIHYTQNFNTISNETAIATMDSEYNTIVNTFGKQPKTWVALASSGNISQAIYAYQRYGMIWRSCESGASWLSAGNLCNPYWQWWNTSIAQGIVFPAFTIATDKEPITGSSINASYFTMFSNGFAANNIRLCGLNEYYFTQSAQNTTQVNITDSNNSYMRFTVDTSGYPCTLNVMTNMSNVEVTHDGVSVPYTSADNGIVFTATNNTTYELRSVLSSPVANFTSNLTSGNVPFTVQFNDTSTGNPTSWDWNFGDGTYSNIQNATHTFTTAGLYHVTLTASRNEISSTITKDIVVSEQPASILPVANFSTNVTEGFAPLSVQFNDSSENANSVNWDFNSDGINDSTERNPIYEFATQGTYTVNLAATNGNGTGSKSAIITVSEKPEPVLPVANFIANRTQGTTPLTVKFTDTSTNSPTGWQWNFGDRNTSTEQSPEHIFSGEGIYNVILVATNGNGSSNVKSINITVNRIPTSPVAYFTANLTVKFIDTSTNSPDKWEWNFGDGSTSTKQNPEHIFSGEGTYHVTLVATNDGGSSDVRSMDITVKSVLTPPVANFAADKTEGTTPLTVKFTDTSTNHPTGWKWNFGDGSTSTVQNPAHTFSGEGTYTVTLVATNGDGSSGTKSMDIKINRVPTPPVADFTADKTEGTTPLTVKFTDTSTNSPTGWKWNFGDSQTSTEQNPEHTFNGAGTYTVTLVATNVDGSSGTKSMNIKVNRVPTPPVADFTSKQTGAFAVQFNDTSSNSPNKWSWELGDGSTSTDSNPAHTYAAAKNYAVNLTVSNADGTDTASKTITVTGTTGTPKASFTAVPTFGRAPLTVKFTDTSTNAASLNWNFGDGATSTSANPSHTYRTRGFYTAKLTATNGGSSSTASKTIYVSS